MKAKLSQPGATDIPRETIMNWPKEWKGKTFLDCIVTIPTDRSKQIQANSYLKNGKFPVVDQGQTFIAGWTNNESSILRRPLPLIIFGDHTRAFKYVDFPFAVGADGTKIFKVDDGEFDSRFFYYKLLSLDIRSKGYSRHFKSLKEQEIVYPPLPEQRKIAAVLFKIRKAIELQEAIIERARELKKSTMQFVFTHGLRGEKTKETEIGRIPESWKVFPVSERYDFTKGMRPHLAPQEQIPFLPMDLIPEASMDLKSWQMRDAKEISSGTYFEKGDMLLAKITPCFENGKQTLTNNLPSEYGMATTEVIPIKGRSGTSDIRYLFYYLLCSEVRALVAGKMEGATGRQRVPVHVIKNLPMPIPSAIHEQGEIADVFVAIDRKIESHAKSSSALQDLFKTMLNKLMSGEIRVKDLKIEEEIRTASGGKMHD